MELIYCPYCGNKKIYPEEYACSECDKVLRDKLSVAHQIYQYLQDQGQCCGGLSYRKDHLHFHGSGWECSYGDDPLSIHVEMGVNLYENYAVVYWIFDDDSSTEGMEYGCRTYYVDPDFHEQLHVKLHRAAEVAWRSDFLTCHKCGYHYHVSNGSCCEVEGTEGQDRESYSDDQDRKFYITT